MSSLFHYGAKPRPNFEQLMVNFGSKRWLAFNQLPESSLSQLLDPTLSNCWLEFQPVFLTCGNFRKVILVTLG